MKKSFDTGLPREGFTTKSGSALPRVVPTSRFHEYVPGETPVHIDNAYWGGLSLNVFHFPASNEGVAAPGIPGCGLAYFDRGDVKKAYYGYDGSSWIPHSIQPGTFQLVDSRCGPKWQWEMDKNAVPLTAVNLILEPEILKTTAYQVFGTSDVDVRFDNRVGARDPLVGALAEPLKQEAGNGTPLGRLYGETAAQLLAVHLLKHYSAPDCKLPLYSGGLSKTQLQGVLEYFDIFLDRDISLQSLAGVCGLSVYHFARLFKQSMGMPPHQYLISRRMDKAKQLLRLTRIPMLDVALAVGYRSQSHFSTLFKRHVGVTPREYRARC